MSFEKLLSPMKIGSMTVRNRTVMTAAEMSLGQIDGRPTEKLMSYYEERAKGGVGLIIPGVTRVNDTMGTFSFTQLAMSQDYHIAPMHEFAERIHSHGAKLGIQLHHPGRQGYGAALNSLPVVIPLQRVWPGFKKIMFKLPPPLLALEEKGIGQSVQAPSVVERSYHGAGRMHAMSKREIHKLQQDFINAAYRCKLAGVDVVELHAGHGYLIQQFLSPNTNHRTDEYGGSLENRMRFIAEIIAGIREKCGRDYPLMVRLTADEMYARIGKPGKGYTLEEGREIARRLEAMGVDAIDVTSACYDAFNYWAEPTSFVPGWRAYLAKGIKEVVNIPVVAANFIRSPEQAEKQIEDGWQDFMASARCFICDPEWVRKVEEGRTNEIRRCIGCLNCTKSLMDGGVKGEQAMCALNPAVGREMRDKIILKNGEGRLCVVVGAGPAGLKAAETLLRRGFAVKVLEKEEKLGGQVKTAATCLLKDKLIWCIEDLLVSVKKLGGEVITGVEATAESILAMKPYAVVIATGGVPIVPKSIKGVDGANVCTAPEIIHGTKKFENQRVAVIGSGLTGLETAEFLAEWGNDVTVVEMANEVSPGGWFQLVDDELSRLEPAGVKFRTGMKLLEVSEGKILCENVKTGSVQALDADSVVLSLGVRPVNGLAKELDGKVKNLVCAGDSIKSGTIANAVRSGYFAALEV